MEGKPAAGTQVTMSRVMEPTDANFLGKVFGGSLLALLDLTAYATASRFAENICVTASFDRVDFIEPIDLGELVSCIGRVTYVGRTSVEVTIEVFADNILSGKKRHTNTARVTMVALKDGKPCPVPRLLCETQEEKVDFLLGKLRRELRKARAADYDEHAARISTADTRRLDALIEAPELLEALSQ